MPVLPLCQSPPFFLAPSPSRGPSLGLGLSLGLSLSLSLSLGLVGCGGGGPVAPPVTPSLVVTVGAPVTEDMESTLPVSGSVAAWQEMSLGVELTGIRVAEVLVEVGDKVAQGQPLLRLDARTLQVQSRQAEAGVAEARASLALARANSDRGATLVQEGLISSSDADELAATLIRAEAQFAGAEADQEAARLRLGFATLNAPDGGVISGRAVQPGQIVTAGTDLLRLIRRNRLEWRAEVNDSDLSRVRQGTTVELLGPDGQRVVGRVRAVAPAVDATTRTGLLYADLPEPGSLRAGMFAQGQLLLGRSKVTVLPREAIIFQDGFAYVFVVPPGAGAGSTFNVRQRRITVGTKRGGVTALAGGLGANERVVLRGAGFLSDGDLVRAVANGNPAR